MTQLEFDKTMSQLRMEHEEKKDQIKEGIQFAEKLLNERKERIRSLKEDLRICKERVSSWQKTLQAENASYKQKRNALMTAFPEAYGKRTDDNCRKRHEPYAVRAMMIATLKEQLKDCPGIDVENINVHFHIEGDTVTYQAILPKKND